MVKYKSYSYSQNVLILDMRFRRRDPRFEREHRQRQRRTDRLTLADFEYQEGRDEYGCPHGEIFRLQVKTVIADGVVYKGYHSDGKRCKGCELLAHLHFSERL